MEGVGWCFVGDAKRSQCVALALYGIERRRMFVPVCLREFVCRRCALQEGKTIKHTQSDVDFIVCKAIGVYSVHKIQQLTHAYQLLA